MKFCSECGETVAHIIPDGDDRHRYVCTVCHTIHYHNPKVIVGTLPFYQQKVLLCKRAIEPRKGFWTLPAGFMENKETSLDGALRETQEEAGGQLADVAFYRLFDLPHINQVYLFYRGELIDGHFEAGVESLEVQLFDEQDIPWQELAFPVVRKLLEEYFEDRKLGEYPVRQSAIERLIPEK